MSVKFDIEEDLIRLDNQGINFKILEFDADEIVEISYYLNENFGLNLLRSGFTIERTMNRKGEIIKAKSSDLPNIIKLLKYCYELSMSGIDITQIIRDFNESQRNNDREFFSHTFSLSKLAYRYNMEGYKIEIIRREKGKINPDFLINDLSAELKVRTDPDIANLILNKLGIEQFETNKEYEISLDPLEGICIDLGNAIKSRLLEASKQADVVFFDFSYLPSLPSITLKVTDEFREREAIPPKKGRIIIFSTMGSLIGEDFYSDKWLWTYLDFDQMLWKFFSNSQNITNTTIQCISGIHTIHPPRRART